jgi:hypothetical protein
MEKYMKGKSFLVIAFVITLISACDGADSRSPTTAQSELDDNIAFWAEAGSGSYQFTYSESCFFLPEEAIVTTVVLDEITEAFYTPSGVYLSEDDLDRLYTINTLFALIQAAITDDVAVLEVTYNIYRGYPEKIFIDVDKNVTDDEITREVTDYQ